MISGRQVTVHQIWERLEWAFKSLLGMTYRALGPREVEEGADIYWMPIIPQTYIVLQIKVMMAIMMMTSVGHMY